MSGEAEEKPLASKIKNSLDKVQSKGLDYLDTVIKIIIFLIFLNLFITTYFYFTTSIEATANRSNCGGASLCEAETHRHLFLEDNGNDKARDIYIIIVVIFSIYLLSEIFKNSKDGIDFTDITSNYIFRKNIVILCFIASVILIELAKFYFVSYDADYSTDGKYQHFEWELKMLKGADKIMFYFIFAISCVIFGIVVMHLGINFNEERAYNSSEVKLIYGTLSIMLGTILGYDIFKVVSPKYDQEERDPHNEEYKNITSKGFESTNFNSKFKAKTAIDIILITFYGICILVFGFGGYQHNKGNNYDITLYIIALSLLAILLVTLYIFILNSSVDWSRPDNTHNYDRYFVFFKLCLLAPGIFPGLLALFFNSEKNIIKLIVFYYAILFIIYLFYVYFVNHNNESGILSLAYFQLYNYTNITKNKKIKGSENTNYYKQFNEINVYFVVALLIILIVIGGLNEDPNLDNIIYGIIVFIIASYITGIVYLLYNTVFPIQQASFNYKKNLVDINNEISQHIKVEDKEHTIDINKIRIFKIANNFADIRKIHEKIDSERGDGTKDKEKHMKNIRDIFSEISPKGSSYEDYRSQSTDQMQYEEYIYRLFSNWTNTDFKFQPNFAETIFGDDDFEPDKEKEKYRSNSYKLYNSIILKLPKNKAELIEYTKDNTDISTLIKKIEANNEANIFIAKVFKIPKTNIIEYVIKKNYKYVTGEEGEIQKYNSDREMDQDYKNALYWIKLTDTSKKGFHYDNTYFGAKDAKAGDTYYTSEIDAEWYRVDDGSGNRHREFFSAFKYNKGSEIKTPSPGDHDNDDEIRNMLSNSSEADIFKKIGLSQINTRKIGIDTLYKMKISEFNKIKEKVKDKDRVYFMVFEDKQTKRINCYVSYNITNPESPIKISSEDDINTIDNTELQAYIEKTYPSPFYTIGYDYENYTEDHQQMNKDTAYSIPARYYACSYLNYFPNEDGSMSKVKFAKNIKEDNYNPLNTKNTIVDRIAKSYNANAKATKIELAPEKFQFLLVFLVILAIIILMFLFNIIKKYFTGDVYTPQMYVLGILGVFLTTFIFGEVIFARLK